MLEFFFLVFLTYSTRATEIEQDLFERGTQVRFCYIHICIIQIYIGFKSEDFWIFFYFVIYFLTNWRNVDIFHKISRNFQKFKLCGSRDLRWPYLTNFFMGHYSMNVVSQAIRASKNLCTPEILWYHCLDEI